MLDASLVIGSLVCLPAPFFKYLFVGLRIQCWMLLFTTLQAHSILTRLFLYTPYSRNHE